MTSPTKTRGTGVHAGRPVLAAGAPLERARAAMILLHGRGADAADILGLAGAFGTDDVAYFAPDAAGNTWYPYRFIEPTARNQPHLASALEVVAHLLVDLEAAGVAADRVVVGGFSQGACLATTFAATAPRRFGGIVALSGGLIGSDAEAAAPVGDLLGTPVFLGVSDVDPHIPLARVNTTGRVLSAMQAAVQEAVYPGLGHTIVEDEVRRVRALLAGVGRNDEVVRQP